MISKELINEALDLVTVTYHKIIKANLTKNTWVPIRMYDSEWNVLGCEGEPSLTKALDWFLNSDYIYQDDKEVFKKFANVDDFRKRFKTSKNDAYIIYRRKIGIEYRWVCLGIKPCVDYQDDDQKVMIYIKDIQDIYSDIYDYIKSIEETALRDTMTRIRNRNSYDNKIKSIQESKCETEVTVIFCDVNDLKQVNDKYGYSAGDRLIRKVADLIADFFEDEEIYRYGGDEFVIIIENTTPAKLISLGLKSYLGEKPLFAFGVATGDNKHIVNVVRKAEKLMRSDKKKYHEI